MGGTPRGNEPDAKTFKKLWLDFYCNEMDLTERVASDLFNKNTNESMISDGTTTDPVSFRPVLEADND